MGAMGGLLVVVLVIALLMVMFLKYRGLSGREAILHYRKAEALLTPAERSFFGVLSQSVGKDFLIFAKVRVADVLAIDRGISKSNHQIALNRITSKHFDFVLCSPKDLSILCVIELNDGSHGQRRRQDRDAFLESACKAAMLPLVMVPARASYSPYDLAGQIAQALTISGNGKEQGRHGDSSLSNGGLGSPAPTLAGEGQPTCPRCASPMVKRVASRGEKAGQAFWGCSRFPECREMLPN